MNSIESSNIPSVSDPGIRPVSTFNGVGPALLATLQRLDIERCQDLWFHLPLRYEDRTRITAICDLRVDEQAQVEGVIEAIEKGFRFRPQLKIAISDSSQHTLTLRFFHFRKNQLDQLSPGTRLRCFGEVRHGAHGLEMVHPSYQRLQSEGGQALEDRLTPVYPTTEGLGQTRLMNLIQRALAQLPSDDVLELIPQSLRDQPQLTSLRDALTYVHRPPPDADLVKLMSGQHPAQQRLALEELLAHHLSLKQLRERMRIHCAAPLSTSGNLHKNLLSTLSFELTKAQRRVIGEIFRDIKLTQPMMRLVQGDVGSGKTIVAALAALTAVESGYQVALMAPTELLAEQHLRNFQKWLTPLSIKVSWLAGKVQGANRRRALEAVATDADIVIGTHALMQEGVTFRSLGLVIIDEQHRFGVHQRLALRDKGREGEQIPHQLVLTATPIPRTLAMTLYADLDVSVIDELPPGRTPVTTVAINNSRRREVIERIRTACKQGRQAYWVCTLIEESDQLQAQAAETSFAELSAALPELTIGLIHGRLKAKEKQQIMAEFNQGAIALLVATTVIEVGVDVPNASLMIIENAERLGLAQLHQLRGRVGRGSQASSCVLLYQKPLSNLARQRLDIMRQTNDGFRIAEKDLELRGSGELLGTRQTGQLAFRMADITRDSKLLPLVQTIGTQMLQSYPTQAEKIVDRWIGKAAQYAGA